ncbi:MAG TPA: hypothetical protein VKP67_14615 [Xanthobacteraceae bacterium]|nr:hypothetical protein [Xanthobacteraceae bacterium]
MTANRIFSDDNAKAEKAAAFGYYNIIHYLAPADIAGYGDVCSHRSLACTAACLGWHSGHAAIGETNNVREARLAKTRDFMTDRQNYLVRMVMEIARAKRYAAGKGLKLCVRLNGSSDIAWEGIRLQPSGRTLLEIFPEVTFVDYTKNPRRFARPLPPNYHLTFSRSETNEAIALELLERGVNVAVVFAERPLSWRGHVVVNGDESDLRHLDPRAPRPVTLQSGRYHYFAGYVIGLTPKGSKAKKDSSGFVVR